MTEIMSATCEDSRMNDNLLQCSSCSQAVQNWELCQIIDQESQVEMSQTEFLLNWSILNAWIN